MKVKLSRIGPSGVIEEVKKDLNGPIDSSENLRRIDALQYGNSGTHNQEDPLWQCRNTDSCSWATHKVIP